MRSKISSRNQKRSDLYTKSVPSLTTAEQAKTNKEISSITSTEVVDKKTQLLKDASLALAMTMSPKS